MMSQSQSQQPSIPNNYVIMTSSSIKTTTTTTTATATTWSAQLNTIIPRRPWCLLFNENSLSCPNNVYDVVSRIKTNFCYFYINYLIIILSFTFFLYFFNVWSYFMVCLLIRDEPPVYNERPMNMAVVWIVVWILFWAQFVITGALGNVFLGLGTGVAVVFIYLVFRRSDDLYLNEEEAVEAGLVASSTGSIDHHYDGPSNLSALSKLMPKRQRYQILAPFIILASDNDIFPHNMSYLVSSIMERRKY